MAINLQKWKEAKKCLQLSYDEIALRANIPKTTLTNIFTGRTENPRIDTVKAIEKALELDDTTNLIFEKYSNIFPVEKRKIPMLGNVACGKPIYADEDKEHYIQAGTDIHADFCLTAKGDSMIGARIMDGDLVFCRRQDMVDNGDIAVVIIGEEATLKRVYYYPAQSKLVLQAENPKYEPFVYVGAELNEIHILGKAIAFQSDIK